THRLFGIRSCNEVITGKRGRPCLEYDIKRCIAPCVDEVCSPDEYARAVATTQLFLEGKNDELIETLRARMAEAAEHERFNQAETAQYDALETLQHVLALPSLPRRIECFDISTIQGSETVASMVVCEDGRMRRSDYRKFRIRGGVVEAGGWGLGASRKGSRKQIALGRHDPSMTAS